MGICVVKRRDICGCWEDSEMLNQTLLVVFAGWEAGEGFEAPEIWGDNMYLLHFL